MKRAVIIGATSGLGWDVAEAMLADGWILGVVGRNRDRLAELQDRYGADRVCIAVADVTDEGAAGIVEELVERLGGMDKYLHFAGIGFRNVSLDMKVEMDTVKTNADGFVKLVGFAYNWFRKAAGEGRITEEERGHIVAVSSVAATRGTGTAPAYSATKKMQTAYIEALAQLAAMDGVPVDFTDIRPGFVATPMLGRKYPGMMSREKACRIIMNGIKKRKSVLIFDWRFRVLVFFWKLIPRSIWVRMTFVK